MMELKILVFLSMQKQARNPIYTNTRNFLCWIISFTINFVGFQ